MAEELNPDWTIAPAATSPAERGKWASEHTARTGHDNWLVLDQPRVQDDSGEH